MTTTLAAMTFAGVLVLLAGFQMALTAGAPLGRLAWGGKHEVLPTPLRIGSAISILLYSVMALVVLGKAGTVQVFPDDVATVGTWVVSAYSLVGIVMNAISRSMPERFVMVPVATVLFISSLLVALGPL